MALDAVNTPDGPMRVAGALRPAGALITDILMVVLLVAPFAYLAGVSDGLIALIWACGIVGYCLFALRGTFPSFGRWAVGLRRYTYAEVEGYAGKGVLYVYEDLPPRIYTLRFVASLLMLGALLGMDLAIT
jgi:hypothetical protein